jgi:hypothetical protein
MNSEQDLRLRSRTILNGSGCPHMDLRIIWPVPTLPSFINLPHQVDLGADRWSAHIEWRLR